MSLKIYTHKEDIPNNIKYVNYNDKFFSSVELKDDTVTRDILSRVDKATYNSSDTFIGRDVSLGALNKNLLSTGCKTLLNIGSHPEICFDTIECGQNAIKCLTLFKQGNILWEFPVIVTDKNETCDIEVNNKKFTHIFDLAEYFEKLYTGDDEDD